MEKIGKIEGAIVICIEGFQRAAPDSIDAGEKNLGLDSALMERVKIIW